jgi:tetratricopeptide (TPR) repeat protein
VYTAKGQYNKAIDYHEEGLKIQKLIHKDEPHLDVAQYLNNLGNTYAGKGQYDKAIDYYEESLKIKKLIYKDEPYLYFNFNLFIFQKNALTTICCRFFK